MTRTVRVGIVGLGMISHRHMTIYRHINEQADQLGFRVEIAAVAEVIPERLKEWAAKYNIDPVNCYVDFHDLLKRNDIDCIDVCVHTNYHVPVSIECMKAGYDVYCEKPAASTYADCKLMLDASEKLGRKLHIQMSSVMTPQSEKARAYMEAGKLGNPYYVNLEVFLQRRRPGYDLPDFPQGFLSKKVAGYGQSVDLGVYVIGQILYILGCPKVASVNGFAGQFVKHDPSRVTIEGGFDVDDTIDGTVRFENGTTFHYLNTSANNLKNYMMTYILGTDGAMELTGTDMAGYKFARPNITDDAGFMGEPEVVFHEAFDDHVTDVPLNCDAEGMAKVAEDPKAMYRYDNQCMWIAYQQGLISEEERINTTELALNQLLITDGMFLSNALGRSVTYDEIIANSPSNYVREQMINGKLYTYDITV
ncbi:MAG: Gfo/Idh/MocA family oxidoreductase [Blautia sp.]|nr:Gfo/Idh/MocA family oxidoreductase [Blautia sp.]